MWPRRPASSAPTPTRLAPCPSYAHGWQSSLVGSWGRSPRLSVRACKLRYYRCLVRNVSHPDVCLLTLAPLGRLPRQSDLAAAGLRLHAVGAGAAAASADDRGPLLRGGYCTGSIRQPRADGGDAGHPWPGPRIADLRPGRRLGSAVVASGIRAQSPTATCRAAGSGAPADRISVATIRKSRIRAPSPARSADPSPSSLIVDWHGCSCCRCPSSSLAPRYARRRLMARCRRGRLGVL